MKWLTLSSKVKGRRVRIKMNTSIKKRKKQVHSASPSLPGKRKTLLGGAICFVILTSTALGVWWILGNSPYFTVQAIKVVSNHAYSAPEIISMAGVKPGENIFRLDLSRCRMNLLEKVNIRDAVIERLFPATIRIKVVEREPCARVKFGQYYTIDAWGVVLEGPKTGNKESLPVIIGMKLRNGQLYPEEERKDCLALLQELDRTGLSDLLDIREIRMGDPEVVVMRTDRDLEIKIGRGNYKKQLERMAAIFPHITRSSRKILSVDLRFSHVPASYEDS